MDFYSAMLASVFCLPEGDGGMFEAACGPCANFASVMPTRGGAPLT